MLRRPYPGCEETRLWSSMQHESLAVAKRRSFIICALREVRSGLVRGSLLSTAPYNRDSACKRAIARRRCHSRRCKSHSRTIASFPQLRPFKPSTCRPKIVRSGRAERMESIARWERRDDEAKKRPAGLNFSSTGRARLARGVHSSPDPSTAHDLSPPWNSSSTAPAHPLPSRSFRASRPHQR